MKAFKFISFLALIIAVGLLGYASFTDVSIDQVEQNYDIQAKNS